MQSTIGRKRVERFVDARTSGSRAGNGRQNEEPGNPKRTLARTQSRIVASVETSPKLNYKRDTKVALRGNPRGVSSNHVCKQAFGDASTET